MCVAITYELVGEVVELITNHHVANTLESELL